MAEAIASILGLIAVVIGFVLKKKVGDNKQLAAERDEALAEVEQHARTATEYLDAFLTVARGVKHAVEEVKDPHILPAMRKVIDDPTIRTLTKDKLGGLLTRFGLRASK